MKVCIIEIPQDIELEDFEKYVNTFIDIQKQIGVKLKLNKEQKNMLKNIYKSFYCATYARDVKEVVIKMNVN